jgi:YVTN family beta-propeller protein
VASPPDGSRVYVVNTGDASLTLVDAATVTVIGTVLTVDGFPTGGERFIETVMITKRSPLDGGANGVRPKTPRRARKR